MPARRLALLAGLVLFDQLLTLLVVRLFPAAWHGLRYFSGLSLPVSWTLSAVILLLTRRYNPGWPLVGAGFLSNMISHLAYGQYVDYIPTGLSYINAADLMILVGCMYSAYRLLSGAPGRPA